MSDNFLIASEYEKIAESMQKSTPHIVCVPRRYGSNNAARLWCEERWGESRHYIHRPYEGMWYETISRNGRSVFRFEKPNQAFEFQMRWGGHE